MPVCVSDTGDGPGYTATTCKANSSGYRLYVRGEACTSETGADRRGHTDRPVYS